MRKGSAVLTLCLLLFLPPTVSSSGGGPLETVTEHVNSALDILRDPSLKGEAKKKVKKEKIRALSETMFDFTELSKRTLSQNWGKMTPAQQKEFIDLYKSILEDAYMDKIVSYTDEKVIFDREVQLSEKAVEVQTITVTRTVEIPINYRVIQKEGQWRVYDVVIEGVSLINNYRSQFREILTNKTINDLLDILRKKVGKR